MVAQRYQTAGRGLLAQGRAELAAGDVRQASEKGWGAAAQMVKAVAASRGWEHRSHAALFIVIDHLVEETGDREIQRLFRVANALHGNFYENRNTAERVAMRLGEIERFLDIMEPLASGGTGG